ncbi:TPA: hypothetical protein K8M67_001478 [Clostridium perfringens]|nr:hypothetical protein [Clostridium perfringens]
MIPIIYILVKAIFSYVNCRKFNLMEKQNKILLIQQDDKPISLSGNLKDIRKNVYNKYKDCDISIEKSRIKQLLKGDTKEDKDLNLILTIASSAILGSLLSTLLGLSIKSDSLTIKFENMSDKVSSIFTIIIGIDLLILILIILTKFIKNSSKDTMTEEWYYNFVLEVLDEIEKERMGIKMRKTVEIKEVDNYDDEKVLSKEKYRVDECLGVKIYREKKCGYWSNYRLDKIKKELICIDNEMEGKLIKALNEKKIKIVLASKKAGIYKNTCLGVYLDKDGNKERSELHNTIIIFKRYFATTIENTLIHEIGHFIDNYCGEYTNRNNRLYCKRKKSFNTENEMYESVRDNIFFSSKIQKNNIYKKLNLIRYSNYKMLSKELFAEMFKVYVGGGNNIIYNIAFSKTLKRNELSDEQKKYVENMKMYFIDIT